MERCLSLHGLHRTDPMLMCICVLVCFSRLSSEPLYINIYTSYWSMETSKVCTLSSYIRGRRMHRMKGCIHYHGWYRLGEAAEIMVHGVGSCGCFFVKVSFNIQRLFTLLMVHVGHWFFGFYNSTPIYGGIT